MSDTGGRPVLKREIGLFGAIALGIGRIIGCIGLVIGGIWFFFRRKDAS